MFILLLEHNGLKAFFCQHYKDGEFLSPFRMFSSHMWLTLLGLVFISCVVTSSAAAFRVDAEALDRPKRNPWELANLDVEVKINKIQKKHS